MDCSELVLIAIVAVVVFGIVRLAPLGDRLRDATATVPAKRRWTLSDWTLVVAAVTLGAVAAGMIAMRR